MEIVTLTPDQVADIVAEATAKGFVEGHRRATDATAAPVYLSAEQAGALMGGLAAKTVRMYASKRGLPCHRPGGKTPLFLKEEVEAWMRSGQ